MMVFSMAMASAVSVPARRRRWYSARAASHVTRGSTTMRRDPRRMRSTTAWPNSPSGLEASGILPQMTTHSGSSNAGSS